MTRQRGSLQQVAAMGKNRIGMFAVMRIKESETVLPFTRGLVEDRAEEIMTGRVR